MVATHPIQVQAPWFREIGRRSGVELCVLYATLPGPAEQGVGFGKEFSWDIPLLDGYRWRTLENTVKPARLDSFSGLDCSDVGLALDEERPDVVVLTGWHSRPLLQALRACRSRGIPTLVRGVSNGLAPRSAWRRTLLSALVRQYDGILVTGKANRRFYKSLGLGDERLFRCPYAVENDRFHAASARLAPQREALRKAWGVPDGQVCLLFAGKLEEKKRPLDVIKAAALANRRGAKVHVLIAGSGVLEAEMKAVAAGAGLGVTFAGFLNQTEIPQAYVTADCLVLPSNYSETWGLVVNEAMACGRPAIVSDRVGCGPDLVSEGQTGWVFPYGSVEVLAEKIHSACSLDLAAVGRRAKERVMGSYTNEMAAEAVCLAAYRMVHASRTHPFQDGDGA